jgi:serine/threonine protein kinase
MSDSKLSDFDKLNLLGRGSYGVVYKVRRLIDNNIYVLKQIDLSCLRSKEQNNAIQEVQILASLDNEYIVRYYDSFMEDNQLNLIMEYCAGKDLLTKLKLAQHEQTPIEESLIWKYLIQLCVGLYHIHDKNILHRDLKAANLFLDIDDNIKIGDLGVARVLGTHSMASTIVGTPYYLSPELVEDRPYNSKSDIWSVGVILYELCSLKHPFEANNQGALILKIIRGKYPPIPSQYNYSTKLQRIIDACLRKDTNARPGVIELLSLPSVVKQAKLLNIQLPAAILEIVKSRLKTQITKAVTLNSANNSGALITVVNKESALALVNSAIPTQTAKRTAQLSHKLKAALAAADEDRTDSHEEAVSLFSANDLKSLKVALIDRPSRHILNKANEENGIVFSGVNNAHMNNNTNHDEVNAGKPCVSQLPHERRELHSSESSATLHINTALLTLTPQSNLSNHNDSLQQQHPNAVPNYNSALVNQLQPKNIKRPMRGRPVQSAAANRPSTQSNLAPSVTSFAGSNLSPTASPRPVKLKSNPSKSKASSTRGGKANSTSGRANSSSDNVDLVISSNTSRLPVRGHVYAPRIRGRGQIIRGRARTVPMQFQGKANANTAYIQPHSTNKAKAPNNKANKAQHMEQEELQVINVSGQGVSAQAAADMLNEEEKSAEDEDYAEDFEEYNKDSHSADVSTEIQSIEILSPEDERELLEAEAEDFLLNESLDAIEEKGEKTAEEEIESADDKVIHIKQQIEQLTKSCQQQISPTQFHHLYSYLNQANSKHSTDIQGNANPHKQFENVSNSNIKSNRAIADHILTMIDERNLSVLPKLYQILYLDTQIKQLSN